MTLLTTTDLADWVETDLSATVLQIYLDDAEAEIIKRFGAHGESGSKITEDLVGNEHFIFPSRPVSTVSTVVEREDDVETTLDATDYRSVSGGHMLERLDDGTNQADDWAPEVRITYTPVSELATRKRVQADLVRLALEYRGLRSESAGDHSQTYLNYQEERNNILAALETGRLIT